MLKIVKGDLLEATENIICHQVNVDGVMGGGLALQIAKRYPDVKKQYQHWCKLKNFDYDKLKGDGIIARINDNQMIENCFTQKPNFDTDYEAIKKCFTYLYYLCKQWGHTICIPWQYGCGIANGDWATVESILLDIFDDYDITIYKKAD